MADGAHGHAARHEGDVPGSIRAARLDRRPIAASTKRSRWWADSPYGLQAGVYTNDFQKAFAAVRRLDVGGVMINDTSIFRVDHMPYGGNRMSGIGREGVRFAIEEMTNIRMVVIGS